MAAYRLADETESFLRYALFIRYGDLIPVRFRERDLFRDAGELYEDASDEAKKAFHKIKTGTATV